jgi:phosphatidylglycerol:prolipoprotein diacylglycerol transferase
MLPVLLDLKFIKIYTNGIFLMLAFFWAMFLIWRNVRMTSYKEEDIFDGIFLGLTGGLFFGRLFYVVVNFKEFGFDFLKFVLINGYPGISVWGVIAGCLITLYFFFSSRKIDFKEIVDYFISPIFLALMFGKLGSFFSGSEVGAKTNFFLKMKFPGHDGMRHLTSFYEALFFAFAAYLSYRLLFEIRKERYSHGFLLAFFLWFFSLTYFIFDKIKAPTLYLQGYSFNMVMSGAMLLTTSFYFIYYKRQVISNFITNHGQKAIHKIRNAAKGKIAGGETKKS